MAMPLGINIPQTPSAGNSPTSDGSSNPPRTPISPNMHTVSLDQSTAPSTNHSNPTTTQMKRKPSRRANTAERRATHNAVERQRRETLNGRFLDLAALLPNLSQIRRPSKSSIVNSSIAYVHASRRHRQLASRELRLLKLEADALRREVNEWRDRTRLPHVEEPVRGEGFTMVLSGEIEVLSTLPEEEEENSAHGGYDGYDDVEEDFLGAGASALAVEDNERHVAAVGMINGNGFAHGSANSGNNAHVLSRPVPAGPMIVSSPTVVSFENPAMYESNQTAFAGINYIQQHQMSQQDVEKWNSQMFSQPQQQPLVSQGSLFTPPTSAHGLSPSASPPQGGNAATTFSDSATHFFANLQKQQQQQQLAMAGGHAYGSPEVDDGSSIGSGVGGGRERRGSCSTSSGAGGYMTPPHPSPPTTGNFEFSSSSSTADFAAMKRSSVGAGIGGLHLNTGGYVGTGGAVDGLGMNFLKHQSLSTPISVGGGGNNGGFAMMMM